MSVIDEYHPVMQRVMGGEANETDKEWLSLLWDFFELVDLRELSEFEDIGFDSARSFAGLVAMSPRYNAAANP